MDEQERVAAFFDRHDLTGEPKYRILDLASEVGEIAKDATTSTGYGADPESLAVSTDELGDALFPLLACRFAPARSSEASLRSASLLAVCEALDVDASSALDRAIEKYDRRMAETGDPGSGE